MPRPKRDLRPASDIAAARSPSLLTKPGADGGPGPDASTPERRLLRVQEAADLLGISRAKTYELIAAGALRSVSIGRSRRVPLHCIDEYVEHLLDGTVN